MSVAAKSSILISVVIWIASLFLVSPALSVSPVSALPDPALSSAAGCLPLPPPAGTIVDVSTVAELQSAVDSAAAGTTIRVADGAYHLNGVSLCFDVPNVTLRSATGNRDAVILDGDYVSGEIIQIAASHVTIADLTLREATHHPIHVVTAGGSDTLHTVIYNVHLLDPGQQAIKINPGVEGGYVDDGLVACSRIELTAVGRPHVWDINESCYTGGLDAHQARGWIVRDNHIQGFWCDVGLAEHAIHFWRGSRDTLVERNLLVDNARGIGFGLGTSGDARTYPDDPCPSAGGGYVGHYDGTIRNNVLFASSSELFASEYGFDCGVCLWQACGAQVIHNTVASTQQPFSSIEWRFDNTDADLVNNLVSHQLLDRGGTARLAGNLEYQPLSLFVDATGGNLHLAATASVAIDQGVVTAPGLCDDDIDGDLRPNGVAPDVGADEYGSLLAPVLKWQRGGCFSSWCETGWYSSPAVADLDGDGTVEVIASAYSIVILDGETGTLEWRMASGHDRSEPGADNVGRTWPGIVVADLDGNGDLEIVTAHSGGYLSVYDHEGYFQSGWPRRPTTLELRGVSVHDLDADGSLELIATGAVYGKLNTWVYEHDGTLRAGWPQLSNDTGYAYGVFNDNAAVGDLDGDGLGEIVLPSDVHYICAYKADGTQIPAHPMYGAKAWGKVGVWESLSTELRGWGMCDGVRAESYRPNFAHGPAVIADLDGNGAAEVVAIGNVYDCSVGHPPGKYNGVYLFHADRSRFVAGGYDWQSPPVDTGPPLSEDYDLIENNQPNPVVADLDGDRQKEILFSSYDGRVHAFWLDKTEHGNWPYQVYDPAEGFYRFASEPTVADLDGDGLAEVIFASWVQKETYHAGRLHILDHLGSPIHVLDLPPAHGTPDWNGALAAPTLANLDADDDLELVLNTAHSGFVAYDLPGTENAHILWGTGRGNYQRTGSIPVGTLRGSSKRLQTHLPGPGDVLTYTIQLQNPGSDLVGVRMTDTLPTELHSLGNLWASSGTYTEEDGLITWLGDVTAPEPVTVVFAATVDEELTAPHPIVNVASIADGQGQTWQRVAATVANGHGVYLPLALKY